MNNKFLFVLSFVFVFSLSFVIAQGLEIPNQFYGTATYNSVASTEMAVEAYIDGSIVGTTTTSGGKYGYDPLFLIKDPEGTYAGKTISFYLNGIDTGASAVFENGASTKLDLSATGSSGITGDTNTEESSSGGGSSCTENWRCEDWGECENGIQTTTCEDVNKCGTKKSKPDLQRVCDIEGESGDEALDILTTTEPPSFFSRITGAVIGGGTARIIIPIIFLILIVWAVIAVYIKRKEVDVDSSEVVDEDVSSEGK